MPYIPDDDNNKDPNAPINTASAPASVGPQPGGKNSASNANPPQPFQNLQAYLSANQDQIQNQADKISGDLTSQYGQTVADVNQAGQDFGKQVQGGYTAPDQGLIDQAANNPTAFVQDPNNVANFQKQWNNTYTGPTNFESSGGYGNVNKEVEKAAANANLVGTNSGLQTYLQNKSSGQYTGGDSTLDAALLRGNPNAITQVQNAAKPFQGLNDYLSGTVKNQNQSVQDAVNAAQGASQGAQNRFIGQGGIVPTFEQNLTDALNALKSSEQQKIDLANSAVSTPVDTTNIPQNQKYSDALGFQNPTDYLKMFHVADLLKELGYQENFPGYLTTQPTADLNLANVANGDDYAKAAALAKLTGQDGFLNPDMMTGRQPINRTNFDIAGAAKSELDQANDVAKRGRGAFSQDQWNSFNRVGDPDIVELLKRLSGGGDTQLYPGGTPYSGPGGPK